MSEIPRAVQLLRSGGLVAFPTETVYGLGADATNEAAVSRIFTAKGRPSTNPLIVHVADESVARRYATHWPEEAEALARALWPGPITLVLPKSRLIVASVTAGLDTVGLRAPDHPLALALLRAFDGAVAAPSANRSNRVSPTTAEHVSRELGDGVDLILDGGPCRVGIESTVLDLTRPRPTILRLGGVSAAAIEHCIGAVDTSAGSAERDTAATSPGRQPVHYAPAAPTYRFASGEESRVAAWCEEHPRGGGVLLTQRATETLHPVVTKNHRIVPMPLEPVEYARRLYAALHEADDGGAATIWIELPPDQPEWAAVRDRIIRASRPA